MKVYITRHGQVLHNVLREYSTADESLTDIGIKQAENLKEQIKEISFDVIISSPTKRTIETAKIINQKNSPIITDDRLKERDCAYLNGISIDKTDREDYWNYYGVLEYGTCEEIKPFFARIYAFLDELKEKDYRSVLIVTHSGVTRAIDTYFNGIQDGKTLHRGLKNCEIKEYDLN